MSKGFRRFVPHGCTGRFRSSSGRSVVILASARPAYTTLAASDHVRHDPDVAVAVEVDVKSWITSNGRGNP